MKLTDLYEARYALPPVMDWVQKTIKELDQVIDTIGTDQASRAIYARSHGGQDAFFRSIDLAEQQMKFALKTLTEQYGEPDVDQDIVHTWDVPSKNEILLLQLWEPDPVPYPGGMISIQLSY